MNGHEEKHMLQTAPLRVRSVEPFALEVQLARPVRTPMTTITTAVSLLVLVTDQDGFEGWGEIWCNFPRFGFQHRAKLLSEVIAPLLVGRTIPSPEAAWHELTHATNILRIQSGEPGPVAAVLAGLDIALYDLAAKRSGMPLWKFLGANSGTVRAYASLGRGVDVFAEVERALDRGFCAIKLHSIGDISEHLAEVEPIRRRVGDGIELMLDVNSSWRPEDAIASVHKLENAKLSWLEEPIPVDAPVEAWKALASCAPMPLAGGENMLSERELEAAISHGFLGVFQPDVAKWGGVTGCLSVARKIVRASKRYCPHMFSGAPGLLASAHLLAASGCPNGLLEFRIGSHPLRDPFLPHAVQDGALDLGNSPGLGLTIDRKDLAKYLRPV